MVEQEPNQWQRRRTGPPRILLVFGAWGMLVAGSQLYAWHAMLTPSELLQSLLLHCQASVFGPLLFIGAATVSPLLLVPAALLGGLAGACFGPVLGVVYTLIGCNLSALLTYSLGRICGQGDGRIARLCVHYGARLRQNPFLSVILLRLSFLPYDPINYLIGMLHVRVGPFLVANTLGSLPGVIAIVLAGSAVGRLGHEQSTPNPALLLGVVVLVLLSLVFALGLRRRIRS